MDFTRPCGCKAYRTCLICEKTNRFINSITINKDNGTYVFCPFCRKAWPGWDINDYEKHPNHNGNSIEFPGIFIDLNFLNDKEEKDLMEGIDNMPWDLSQSGRRKQNFGPKCNFKKQKLKLGEFRGFPKFTEFVQHKFEQIPLLKNYQTIEQCSLEYNPSRGASIDPHIDDCWIWGERIITVNLAADSVLTMTKFKGNESKYNLNWVGRYPAVLDKNGGINLSTDPYKVSVDEDEKIWPVVRIPMPRKSLLIMYGAARYDWEHQILREDITKRRVCLAYREFTPPYLQNGSRYEMGRDILENAVHFFET